MKYFLLLLSSLLMLSCSNKKMADMVFIGNIYTSDINNKNASAIAIKEGLFIYVGDDKGVEKYIDNNTEVVHLSNSMILPGFIDAHTHSSFGSIAQFNQVQLYDGKSMDDYFNIISNFLYKNKDIKILRGGGWFNGYVPSRGPSKEVLDKISKDIPIAINSADYHSIWVNSKVLEMLNINANTKDIEGGIIERDPITKEPTGTFREKAHEYIVANLPDYSVEEYKKAILKYQEEALSYGIVALYDPLLNYFSNDAYNLFDALNELDKSGELKIKYFAAYKVNIEEDYTNRLKTIAEFKKKSFAKNFKVIGVKLYVDGVISGKTAYLLEDYNNSPGYKGDLKWNYDALKDVCEQAEKLGLNIHIHAIGDGAVDVSIDALEYLRNKTGNTNNRHAITHIQLIDNSNIKRLYSNNIIAVLNPYWFYKQDGWYYELELPYLGKERADREYPMKSFFDENVVVTTSSDYPVTIPSRPLDAIQIGVTRMNLNGDTNSLLTPSEIVSIEDMISTVTFNGAYQTFVEDKIGSIAVGKNADFIILDNDIFTTPKTNISKINILKTFINGKVVYSR